MKIFRAKPLQWFDYLNEKHGLVDSIFIKREPQKRQYNRQMFNEDFANVYNSIGLPNNNQFEIVSNDNEHLKKLLGNVKTRYSPHSIDETIRELTEEIAQSLVWSGRAFYFLYDDSEQNKIHVASFSASGVMRFFGQHIQWVPKRKDRQLFEGEEEFPREIRILDAAKVMRFDMPTLIKRMVSAQERAFGPIDKSRLLISELRSHATYENPNPTNYFDFRVWKDTEEHALLRATRSTGWNCRNIDLSKQSVFFSLHRLIRFRRNQLLLRDYVLMQLSSELSRVGKSYKNDFSIDISVSDELPSITGLNELELKLGREEVEFDEIINYCVNV